MKRDEAVQPVVAVKAGAGGGRRRIHAAYLGLIFAMLAGLVVYDGARRTGTGAALLAVHDPPPPPVSPSSTAPAPEDRGPSTARSRVAGRVRVATFNMASGVGRDGVRDLNRTARTIREAAQQSGDCGAFDVVALHEVRGEWGSGGGQAEDIAARLTMRWVMGASERRWWRDDFGNAMLIGGAIEGDGVLRIPMPQTQERGWRNVLVVRVPVGGVGVSVLGTHVDRQRDQAAQLRFLRELMQVTPPPAVLMADFNVTRDHPIIREMLDKDGLTEATEHVLDGGKIDMMLVKGLRTVNAGQVDLKGSDHPLVWAELELLK